jgi:hypothetical protein
MNMWRLFRVCMISACVMMAVACAGFGSRATFIDYTDRLSPSEERLAIALAEKGLEAEKYRATGKLLYAVATELLPAKEADEKGGGERKALVTHYQYEGDMAIFSTVNLTQSAVVNVERVPHVPVPLSEQEFVRAKTLALAHPDVKTQVGSYSDRLTIEALLTRSPMETDPLYGHRVVSLLFRVGSDYLSMPEVVVDLTTEKVLVARKEHPIH